MKGKPQQGFAMIEAIWALGFLIAIIGGVGVTINSISHHMRQSERILALDSFELNLMSLITDFETLRHSVRVSGSQGLRNCLLSETAACRNGQVFEQPIFLEGSNEALTGANVAYDYHGNPCQDECDGLRVRTFAIVRCAGTNTCAQPAYVTIRYDIVSQDPQEILRRDFLDVSRFQDGRFPELNISCASSNQVLRGIGINGQALCVSSNRIQLSSEDGEDLSGNFNITPRDCRELNADQESQAFVVGISAQGDLLCGERFW